MKKINNYLLGLIVTSIMIGCTSLDETPTNILSPEGFYQSPEDVEIVTRGAYARMTGSMMTGSMPMYLWLSSDMVGNSGFGALGTRKSYDEFPVAPGDRFTELVWDSFYAIISAANSAIEGATFLDLPQDEIEEAQASARFVRGWAYYNIAMLWGNAPYIGEFVRDTDAVKDITSNSEAFLMARAAEDFQFAKDHLDPNASTSTRSLPTRGTAAAYLAALHLYTGDFANAYTEAKWVIDNRSTYNYALEADFQKLWIEAEQDNLVEPIFVIDYETGIGGGGGFNTHWIGRLTSTRGTDLEGWGLAVPETKVFDSWDDNDPRKRISMMDSVEIGGVLMHYSNFPLPPRPHIRKWNTNYDPGKAPHGGDSGNNFPLMRYAEVLLIAAEAGAEVNGVSAEVEGYVNEIRARARVSGGKNSAFPADVTTGLSKADFIDLVLEERRLELAFELKRWFDIKRRDLGEWVFKLNPDRLEDRPNFQAPRDYHYYIPAPALNVNPNLGTVQD